MDFDINRLRKDFIHDNLDQNTHIYGGKGSGKSTMALWEMIYRAKLGAKVALFVRNFRDVEDMHALLCSVYEDSFKNHVIGIFASTATQSFLEFGRVDRVILDDCPFTFDFASNLKWSDNADSFSSYFQSKSYSKDERDSGSNQIYYLGNSFDESVVSCPKCKIEMTDHFSAYCGSNIKKCPKCGYC